MSLPRKEQHLHQPKSTEPFTTANTTAGDKCLWAEVLGGSASSHGALKDCFSITLGLCKPCQSQSRELAAFATYLITISYSSSLPADIISSSICEAVYKKASE